jgi:hypothetical protein
MDRVVLAVPVLVTVVGGLGVAAWAPAPGAAAARVAAKAAPAKTVCTITDERLTEISGMVASDSGYVVVNGVGGPDSHRKIFFLDSKCKVKKAIGYSSRDPEDVTQTADGTIWVADIGDSPANSERRSTIALWKLRKGADEPTLYRMKYPDGPHDAGALLLAGDGTPIIITKSAGPAGVYTPTAPLAAGKTVPLQKVGTFTPPKTTTSNIRGVPGRISVTGGATDPNGGRVVLRTYADAFEFDVTNGNVVEAITKGTPRITPLPDEPRGESITYSADGKSFLTVSLTDDPKILRYTPSAATSKAGPEKVGASAGKTDTRSWLDKLTLRDITYMIGGVGLLGALLVGVGVFGIVLARRRPPGPEQDGDGAAGSPDGSPPEGARAAPISPMPSGVQGYDRSAWDRQRPAGTEYRSGSVYRPGTEYRSAGVPRGSGGEYRSRAAVPADAGGYGRSEADDQAYRPPGSVGRGGVYGTPAPRRSPEGGTVYGGGSQYGSPSRYEPPYDYADRDSRY